MANSELVKKLNVNLSNLQLFYVKLHNYHWNVQGMNFKPLHEMTEAYYDYFAEQYDEVAERIVQLGGKPFGSLKEYLENATLEEVMDKTFDAKTVLSGVSKDFAALLAEFKDLRKAADEADDPTTVALAEDNIAWLEKESWMVNVSMA